MAMKLDRRGLLSDTKAYWKILTYPQPTQGFMTFLPTTIGLHFFEPRFVKDQTSLCSKLDLNVRRARLYDV